jgi:hypothetical protein
MNDLNQKKRVLALFLLVGFYSLCYGQSSITWSKFDWLMGEWVGEGTGQPGQGNGTFTFNFDLDKKILVRKSHSQYPKAENKPEIIHDDLMVIYPDFSGEPSKAIYFDNEGHTINYSVVCSEKSIVFTSSKMPNVPVFRLSYTLLENNMINTKFEMSRDGDKFITYVEGKSKKVN